MANEAIMTPVEGDDPCGVDLQWDPEFMELSQTFDNLTQSAEAVVEGEVAAADTASYDDIIAMSLNLCARTKDLRVLAIYTEASWYSGGLPGFASALEDFMAAAEQWPDPDTGIHPRADEEDGDLAMRGAVVGRLVNKIPALVGTLGWGANTGITEQVETGTAVTALFDAWTARLEPALGRELPSRNEAWRAIQGLIGDQSAPVADEAAAEGGGAAPAAPAAGAAIPANADAWDMVERSMELMVAQDRHSPAIPVLKMLTIWRHSGIVEIAANMRVTGVSLEQLLESIKQQIDGPQQM